MTVRDWLVTADDRTGAFEVAALLARAGHPVRVDVGVVGDGAAVVDLGTRTMTPAEAAAAVVSVPGSRWRAHKIDSTLRGNWAAEVRALSGRVVVVPAWPAMGRTCIDGIVYVHGEPLASASSPLPEAVGLTGAGDLDRWLTGEGGSAVVDVGSTDALEQVARVLARHDVVLVGPAGPIGAAFRARWDDGPQAVMPTTRHLRVLVCASASPIALAQVARVREVLPDVEVVVGSATDGPLHPGVAHEVAERARSRVGDADLVVLVGGDTAAAVLGSASRQVGGFAAPGMPWSLDLEGAGPVVVTKAGAFGDEDALVRMLSGETG